MNDTAEFRHGLNHVTRVLEEREVASSDPIDKPYIVKLRERLERLSMLNVFIVSFSGSHDLLSQWRAYSKNELGYAVGFQIDRLHRLASRQGFSLERCIYDWQQQRERAEYIVEQHLEYFRTLRDRFVDEQSTAYWSDRLTDEFYPHVCGLAPLFKDYNFSEEKEWRLISTPKSIRDDEYGVRPGRNFLLPYYAFSLVEDGKFTIDQVTVGPSPEPELAQNGVCDLLHRNAVDGWSVDSSQIPFRAS